MPGVLVRLVDSSTGNLVASVFTDGNGAYEFTRVAAGTCFVGFVPAPAEGMMPFTLQDQGGDDPQDSAVDLTGLTACFTLLGSERKDLLDAGLRNPAPPMP